MIDCRGKLINRNIRKKNIFGLDLYTVTRIQLNEKYIYDSDMCVVVTEVNPPLNMDKFAIVLNDIFNLGIFFLYVGYLSTGDQKGVSVENWLPIG